MLSKKYYKIFAELLGESKDLEEFQTHLIAFMVSDNERFDTYKFQEAINQTPRNLTIEETKEKLKAWKLR